MPLRRPTLPELEFDWRRGGHVPLCLLDVSQNLVRNAGRRRSMSGGDLVGVGMGVGWAAVGAGVLATGYCTRGSDALAKVKGKPGRRSRGRWRWRDWNKRGDTTARWRRNGSGPSSPSGGRSSAATQAACQVAQINLRRRRVLHVSIVGPATGPPRSRAAGERLPPRRT